MSDTKTQHGERPDRVVRICARSWDRDPAARSDALAALDHLIDRPEYRRPYYEGNQVRLPNRLRRGRRELATSIWYARCLTERAPEPKKFDPIPGESLVAADQHARRVALIAAILAGTSVDKGTGLLPVYAGRDLRHVADHDPLLGTRTSGDVRVRTRVRRAYVEALTPGYSAIARAERQDSLAAPEAVESVDRSFPDGDGEVTTLGATVESRAADPEKAVTDKLAVREQLAKLAPIDREMLFMQAAGFSTHELSVALELPDYVVRKRIERARATLRAPESHNATENVGSCVEPIAFVEPDSLKQSADDTDAAAA